MVSVGGLKIYDAKVMCRMVIWCQNMVLNGVPVEKYGDGWRYSGKVWCGMVIGIFMVLKYGVGWFYGVRIWC